MNHDDSLAGEHARAQKLLPWLLTGTLRGADLALAERHLGDCAACRADLAWQRRLREAAQLDAAVDPDAALARLLPRLETQPPRPGLLPRRLTGWLDTLAANDSRWLRPLAAAQLAVIAALALLLVRPGDGPAGQEAYRTLGAAAPVQGDLIVGFRPDTPEGELRRILQSSGARVIDGPTGTGAYVLWLHGAAPARALARLRAEPAVTLAEPLAEPLAQPGSAGKTQ